MPPKFCPHCGKALTSASAFCPHCGAALSDSTSDLPILPKATEKPGQPDKVWSYPTPVRVIAALILFTIIGSIVIAVNSSDSDKNGTQQAVDPQATPEANHIDPNNEAALEKGYGQWAQVYCGNRADAYVHSVAKYDHKWDKAGYFASSDWFDKVRTNLPGPGVLGLVSDQLLMQDGSGAYERTEIECDFDAESQSADFKVVTDQTKQ